ncbi:cell division protein FtsL [Bartonella sp. F02]|uniref:cell division protein FtsL n=1 Tax=Bartonella sp. F02 TaxID=2967262 RepID=UPI0022A9DD2E|nr:hypothetical protein [Bartonella sp. F02]MCZ2328673.1 hypothetical protein [Bartonella sp. F02]
MVVFRTLDVVLVIIMICTAGFTYKIKYDVQKQIGEVRRIEHEIASEKNMINLFRAEWAVMTDPLRMKKLAERYQQELGLEMIQPHQVVEFKDIPIRLNDQIEELIRQNNFEDSKTFLADNHVYPMNSDVSKGLR